MSNLLWHHRCIITSEGLPSLIALFLSCSISMIASPGRSSTADDSAPKFSPFTSINSCLSVLFPAQSATDRFIIVHHYTSIVPCCFRISSSVVRVDWWVPCAAVLSVHGSVTKATSASKLHYRVGVCVSVLLACECMRASLRSSSSSSLGSRFVPLLGESLSMPSPNYVSFTYFPFNYCRPFWLEETQSMQRQAIADLFEELEIKTNHTDQLRWDRSCNETIWEDHDNESHRSDFKCKGKDQIHTGFNKLLTMTKFSYVIH